jgi:hypothetical protein
MEPLLREFDQQTPRVAQFWVVWVQYVGGKHTAEVDDGLLIRWHETHGQGPKHLIRVELLVHLSLEGRVIAILPSKPVSRRVLLSMGNSLPAGAEAADHRRVCGRSRDRKTWLMVDLDCTMPVGVSDKGYEAREIQNLMVKVRFVVA